MDRQAKVQPLNNRLKHSDDSFNLDRAFLSDPFVDSQFESEFQANSDEITFVDTGDAHRLSRKHSVNGREVVLLDRYQVQSFLGSGSMGEVVRVLDLQTGSEYALKRLPEDLCNDIEVIQEVEENFKLIRGLRHLNIGATYRLEKDTLKGNVYLLMELIEGVPLSKWMRQQRKRFGGNDAPLPVELVSGVAEQLASALDYMHCHLYSDSKGRLRKGVIHQDLKPANIMVVDNAEYKPGIPLVKLIDFGTATAAQATIDGPSIEELNERVQGTPYYMAPEQWQGRTLTAGVDQWALATLIYELIAGYRPFQAMEMEELEEKIGQAAPDIPYMLSEKQWAVLLKSFNIFRQFRHTNCKTLVAELKKAERLSVFGSFVA